jgi:hypothetical protein
MNGSMKAMLALTLIGASGAICAQETTYDYTGKGFTSVSGAYTKSDSVSGSVTLAAPLPANQFGLVDATVVSFSFYDGLQTINSANADASQDLFEFGTDPTGAIAQWNILIETSPGGAHISTEGNSGGGGVDVGYLNGASQGDNYSDTGVWAEQAASGAPELDPASTASALTLLSGLLLVLRGRRATA